MGPITGVFSQTWNSNPEGPNAVIRNFGVKHWYRQRKPYNLPLPYDSYRGNVDVRFVPRDELTAPSSWDKAFIATWLPFVSPHFSSGDPMVSFVSGLRDDAINKALVRFNAKRGERASLGVAAAEITQVTSMIERRARQTLSVVNSLRKMRLGEAARQLGISPGTVRKKARELSGLQLEISFGWMPFIGDMYKTIEVLNAPIPWGLTRGAATTRGDYILSSVDELVTHKVSVRAYVAAVLEVEHPNSDLARRLGLTNPLSIAFELIPFSFVGNWVINFEEYLSQFNDYPGVKVSNPHWGVKIEDDFAMWRNNTIGGVPNQREYQGQGWGRSFQRHVGSLPNMTLGIRPSIGMGFSRALNAISLLVQKGIRGR